MDSQSAERHELVLAGLKEMCDAQASLLNQRRRVLMEEVLSIVRGLETTWGALSERSIDGFTQHRQLAIDFHTETELVAATIRSKLCTELEEAGETLSALYTTADVLLSLTGRSIRVSESQSALLQETSLVQVESMVGALGIFETIAWFFEEAPSDTLSARIATGRVLREQAIIGIIALAHARLLEPLDAIFTNQGGSDGHS